MSAQQRAAGYPRVARLMGECEEFAVFRRFNELNMLSLLSLQAELIELRDDWITYSLADEQDGHEFSKSFEKLFDSARSLASLQHQTLTSIREKMKEYNALLLQTAQLSRLQKPTKRDLKILRSWLKDSKGGNSFLQGGESTTWSPAHDGDLVTFTSPRPDEDRFTKLLLTIPTRIYHCCWGSRGKTAPGKRFYGRVVDEESGMVQYGESRLDKTAMVVTTTLASTIPMAAIFGLYFAQGLLTRMYIATGITAAFAAILSFFTQARRIEIFAATCSLAAVEVVYIGSTSTT